MEKRHFISFCFPSNEQLQEKSEQNDWLERMIFIYTDLKWLLSLSVDDFWNQVLYDDSWHSCLDSFLQFSPRSYDLRNVLDGCKVALSRVSRMFLLVLKRMSDYNEKFEKGEYGEIIYENFVFDAAKLFDTCSIFYCANNDKVKDILHQIMLNIFECQSNYFNDLSNSVQTLILTLQNIEERIKVSKPNHQLKPINGREAQNMVLYVYDLVNTVSAFLNVFNDSSHVFYQSNVCNSLVAFCENTLPALLELIEIKVGKYRYLCKQIDDVSTKFVQLVIQKAFVESKPSQREDGSLYHLYTSLMDSISECPRFLARYCELGSIQNELEKIATFEGVDISCLRYLKDIVCTSVQENLDDETFDKLKELLPTKSDAYLKTCIESCGHDVSVIMNNIMEGKIEDPEAEPPKEIKMPHVPDATFLDDNREHVALLKASLLPGPEDCARDYEMYEDEYDDTYDTQNIAAADADSADEIIYRRKFTIPAILRQAGDVTPENSDEEEVEENPQENGERSESNDNRNEKNNGGRGGGSRGHHRGRGGGRSGRGNSRGRGGGGPVRGSSGRGGGQQGGNSGGGGERGRGGGGSARGSSGRGGGQQGGNSGGGGERGRGGGDSRGHGGGGRGDSRGSRGRGRGNKRNHKSMADKKHSKGMMPF